MKNENLLRNNIDKYPIELGRAIPDWVQIVPEFVESTPIKSQEGTRYYLINHHFYFEEFQITKFKRTICQPISMQGVEARSKLLIDFNPKVKSLIIHNIIVKRIDKVINKLLSADIQILKREIQAERNIFSGDITLSLILDDIQINDLLIVDITEISTDLYNIENFDYLQPLEYHLFYIEKLFFALTFNKKKPIQYKFLDKEENLKWQETPEKKTFMLEKTQVEGVEIIKGAPYWYWPISYLQFGYQKSWRDIASNYRKFFSSIEISNPELLSLLEQIRTQCVTDQAIVLYLLNFVHKHIRYLANHTATDFVKPTDPNVVFKRAYGDCKDLTFFIFSVLSVFNISSSPILVNQQWGKNLVNVLPSAGFFNHVVLAIYLDQIHIIDPTIRQNVDSLQHLFLPNFGYGLICEETTEDLVNLDAYNSCQNQITIDEQYEIISWKENDIIFKSTISCSGLSALRFQQYFNDNELDPKFWELFTESYKKYFIIKTIISRTVQEPFLKNNQIIFHISFSVSLNSLVNQQNLYACQLFPHHILDQLILNNVPNEIADLYYGPCLKIDYRIKILDNKIRILNKDDFVLTDDVFCYSRSSEYRDKSFIFHFIFDQTKEVVSLNNLNQFLANLKVSREASSLKIGNDITPIAQKYRKKFSLVKHSWLPYISTITIPIMIFIFKENFPPTAVVTNPPSPIINSSYHSTEATLEEAKCVLNSNNHANSSRSIAKKCTT
ncbi:MAG: DUF3857 domain-containing protein [Proteobacteria bacterium]|nr:DUF3857 domain-containing protein [Pseudomonadota bacterium]